jgi:hypothetical protein
MNEDSRLTTIYMSLALLCDLIARLNLSASALSVLGAAIDSRMTTTIWGGTLLTPFEAQKMLKRIGYVSVQRLPTPPSATVAMIAGCRPSQTL